MATSQDMSRRK